MKPKLAWFLCHEKKKMVLSYWLFWVTAKYPDDIWEAGRPPNQVISHACLFNYEQEELLSPP